MGSKGEEVTKQQVGGYYLSSLETPHMFSTLWVCGHHLLPDWGGGDRAVFNTACSKTMSNHWPQQAHERSVIETRQHYTTIHVHLSTAFLFSRETNKMPQCSRIWTNDILRTSLMLSYLSSPAGQTQFH